MDFYNKEKPPLRESSQENWLKKNKEQNRIFAALGIRGPDDPNFKNVDVTDYDEYV